MQSAAGSTKLPESDDQQPHRLRRPFAAIPGANDR